MSAMNYVQAVLSPDRYAALLSRGQLSPTMDPEHCLKLEAGICGNHVETCNKILERCKIPIKRRAVEYYLHDEQHNNNQSHVALEIYYGNGWHLFDITAGTVFVRRNAKSQDDLLSTAEIKSLIEQGQPWRDLAVTNAANSWCRKMV